MNKKREAIYYVDGKFLPAGKAALPLDDLAILRGFGVFEFLRTYGGRPFRLDEHIRRLLRSARLIGLAPPGSARRIAGAVMATLDRNRQPESNIRVIATGGASADFITPRGKPRLIITVTPLMIYPARWYRDGVKVITVPAEPFIPEAKTLNYLAAVIAVRKAKRRGAIEAISIDRNGMVLEGKTTNVFAFRREKLVTTAQGILPGVTRRLILDLTEGIFPREARSVSLKELREADEVFITATNKGIVPVVKVDNTVIGGGRPGPRTQRVMGVFQEYTSRFAARSRLR